MIESFIEGRLRLRSSLLGDKELVAFLSERLLAIDGVTKAEVNPRTRGLLLEYDRARFPLERVKRAAPLLERMAEVEKLPTGERGAALLSLLEEMKERLTD
ncbi:MAG: hypothetical protein IJR68_00635 [Fretibacterium sp.]|nr:hypothetical protein [Fretibacterium sp.]